MGCECGAEAFVFIPAFYCIVGHCLEWTVYAFHVGECVM